MLFSPTYHDSDFAPIGMPGAIPWPLRGAGTVSAMGAFTKCSKLSITACHRLHSAESLMYLASSGRGTRTCVTNAGYGGCAHAIAAAVLRSG